MAAYAYFSGTSRHKRGASRSSRPQHARGTVATGEIIIDAFLRDAGFDLPAAAHRARTVLEEAGLTRPGKRAFIASKLPSAEAALDSLAQVCSDACLELERAHTAGPVAREAVIVGKQFCEVCGGSNNARAALEARDALARKCVRRVVIVGGSPAVREALRRAFAGADLEFRIVDGTSRSHTLRDAEANLRWAQLVVICGSSELRHAVSEHYKSDIEHTARVITAARRGVAAVCGAITESYR